MGLIIAPLLFIYLLIACIVTYKVEERQKTLSKKLFVTAICILFFVGVIAGDAIAGRVYLNYLCNKDGGIKINKIIQLEPTWFDLNGRLKFDLKNKLFEELFINKRYKGISSWYKNYSAIFDISRQEYKIIDLKNNNINSSITQYMFFGGWIEHITTSAVYICPEYIDFDSFLSNVFVSTQ